MVIINTDNPGVHPIIAEIRDRERRAAFRLIRALFVLEAIAIAAFVWVVL